MTILQHLSGSSPDDQLEEIRQLFESHFAVPTVACWNRDLRRYYCSSSRRNASTQRVVDEYQARWEGWRMAIELSQGELQALRVERDHADRRAGAAERNLEWMKDSEVRRSQWLSRAKADEGHKESESFDDVWAGVRFQRDQYRHKANALHELLTELYPHVRGCASELWNRAQVLLDESSGTSDGKVPQ